MSAIKVLMKRNTDVAGRTLGMNPGNNVNQITAFKDQFMVLGSKAWLL